MSLPYALIRRRSRGQVDATIDVERPAATVGTSGIATEVFAAHLSNIEVLAEVRSSDEAVRAGRESSREFVVFHAQAGLDITEKDRVVWNGKTYAIVRLRTPGGREARDRLAWTIIETEEVDA